MAQRRFTLAGVRRQSGTVASGDSVKLYLPDTDTLAHVSATDGGSALASSIVSLNSKGGATFYGPTDLTDELDLEFTSNVAFGRQRIYADADPRLDALEADGGGADATAFNNVKAFGATGDGATDDTAEVAAAYAGGGEQAFFPAGTYKTTQLIPPSGTTLGGAGPGVSQLDLVDDGSGASQTIYLNGVDDVVIRDLYIQQSNAASRTGVYGLIRLENCSRVKILHNRFGKSSSVAVWVGPGCDDILIEGNTVADTFADGIHITRGARNVRVKDNTIGATGDDAIGVISYLDSPTNYASCSDILIEGNHIDTPGGSGRGVAIYGGLRVTVKGNTIKSTPAAGIIVGVNGSGASATRYPVDIDISHNRIYNAGADAGASTRSGIYLSSGRRLRAAHNTVDVAGGDGVTATGAIIEAKITDNHLARTQGRGVLVTQTLSADARLLAELFTDLGATAPASTGMQDLDVSGNHARLCAADGLYLSGEAGLSMDGVTVARNHAKENAGSFRGLAVLYANGITVEGNTLTGGGSQGLLVDHCNNGTVQANSVRSFGNEGIGLAACTEMAVTGNECEGNTGYGIAETTSSTGNLIVGNNVRLNAAGGVLRVGATVRHNLGHATETGGTATVASGATTAVVTHGLAVTPAAKDIRLTPTNNLGNATKYWVSAAGATTFTITVDTDPGVTTATFAWQAQVL